MSNPLQNIPVVTRNLLIVNLIMYVATVINEEFAFTYITNRYNPSETYIYKDIEIEKSWFVCADSVRATNKGKPVSLPEAK